MFRQLDVGLWLNEARVRFAGIPLPHAMTVIKLPNGRLFVQSPTKPDGATTAELDRLGQVDSIIFPGWWHDLYLREYAVAYPDARLFAAPSEVQSLETQFVRATSPR